MQPARREQALDRRLLPAERRRQRQAAHKVVLYLAQGLALALILLCASSSWARPETIDLVTGQQKLLKLPGVSRIAIANPNVADVKVVDQGQVLITAVGNGQTELTVWQGGRVSKYAITVTTMDPQQLRREVDRQLGDRENMRVRIGRDNTVFIEGTVLTLADLEKAEEIARAFPQVRNLAKLDPAAHAQIAAAINAQLKRAGLTGARATVVGETIFLEGVVDTVADLKKAELITKSIGENVETTLSVGSARMVELDVEFVEVSKNSLDRIGVRWPTEIDAKLDVRYNYTHVLRGGGADLSALNGQALGTTSFGLSLALQDGISRTLARPRLVTASAKEAKFLAGGELPIPIVTQDRIYVEYKEHGVRLEITPVVDGSGTIQTKILTEVSDIDDSVQVMGVPGFITRRVDTEVTVRDGETIVLSGLVSQSESKDVVKWPILGQIPIIGELFKSRRFRERQTELVIFVTPRLVDPVSQHLKELSAEMLRKYEEAGDDVGWGLLD